jgi:hypothetical protein
VPWRRPSPPRRSPRLPPKLKGETVEQRITNLHADLKITPDEENQWNGVAQAMRENASAMDKLVATKVFQTSGHGTAASHS